MRSFIPGEELVLNVNISDDYFARHISSIAWYHNGTQITAGNKYSITYSNSSTSLTNTSLSIQNMVRSDAGKYKVKIESIEYRGNSSSPHCDSIMLPILETYAIHSPVTFTVQEHYISTYDPQLIVSSYSIPECLDRGGCTINLRSSGYNISRHNISDMLLRYQSEWYKNGVRIGDGNMYNSSVIREQGLVINSLQITYNNTEDVIGNYIGLTWTNLYRYLESECRVYYNYLCDIHFMFVNGLLFEVSYWRISGELLILLWFIIFIASCSYVAT